MAKQRCKKFRTKGKHLYYEKNVRTCCDANKISHGDWQNHKKIGEINGRTTSNGFCNRKSK
jgi:hypothetical protein